MPLVSEMQECNLFAEAKEPEEQTEIWSVKWRAQISHQWNDTNMCWSAPFIWSHDSWSPDSDQRFKRANESLVSCMLIGCLFLVRPFPSIRGEYGGSTPCFGMYWLFSADGKSHIKSQRRPNTIFCFPHALVSAHFRADATKSISLWQRSPLFQQPGAYVYWSK